MLAESEQMRREADDIGPRAELDHWKKRMSKFNYLLDQIKGSDVKAVLGVLNAAKSKTIKVLLFNNFFNMKIESITIVCKGCAFYLCVYKSVLIADSSLPCLALM